MLWAIVTEEKTAPSPLGFRLRRAECVNQEGWDLTRTQTSFCLPSFGSIKGIHHEFLNILLSIKRHLRMQKGPNTVVTTLNSSCGNADHVTVHGTESRSSPQRYLLRGWALCVAGSGKRDTAAAAAAAGTG